MSELQREEEKGGSQKEVNTPSCSPPEEEIEENSVKHCDTNNPKIELNDYSKPGEADELIDDNTFLQMDKDHAANPKQNPLQCSKHSSAVDDINPSGCNGCCRVFRTARFQVYASHFLSSWGDRMWMFAGGLFLLEVTPGSLRLAAIYGAALALTVIIFGAPVGRLVDRASRLKMAQVSLCVQNIMVCICAAILVVMTTQRYLFTTWEGWPLIIAEGFVILTACIAQVGTLGSKLTIEKDWILVICGQDQTRLAGMNSVLRSLDLSTEVLAPVIVGTVMTTLGMAAGGIFIASWNVGSLLVEYGLLHYLYHSSEDLQKPKMKTDIGKGIAEGDNESVEHSKKNGFKGRLVSAWGAWLTYMRHPVRNAGLGLALLFMTVLAFDNYSRAFVFESGISESILGILTAVASLFGIFGALIYPRLRAKFDVAKTGLIGFGSETLCLIFCVSSVFAPGSPFDATALISSGKSSLQTETPSTTSPVIVYKTVDSLSMVNISLSTYEQNSTEKSTFDEVSSSGKVEDYTSVTLLLVGIITSRSGLWLADLSVTQILQEGVEERHRGAINGVQSSLNQSLDLLRSILLIILPTRETYGFLIILSFIFVATGWALFGVYARHQISKEKQAEARQLEEVNI